MPLHERCRIESTHSVAVSLTMYSTMCTHEANGRDVVYVLMSQSSLLERLHGRRQGASLDHPLLTERDVEHVGLMGKEMRNVVKGNVAHT